MVSSEVQLLDNFRSNVRALLDSHDWTQADLSRAMDRPSSFIAKYMTVHSPGLETISTIADGLRKLGWDGETHALLMLPEHFLTNLVAST